MPFASSARGHSGRLPRHRDRHARPDVPSATFRRRRRRTGQQPLPEIAEARPFRQPRANPDRRLRRRASRCRRSCRPRSEAVRRPVRQSGVPQRILDQRLEHQRGKGCSRA
jgi:hypothetical protein